MRPYRLAGLVGGMLVSAVGLAAMIGCGSDGSVGSVSSSDEWITLKFVDGGPGTEPGLYCDLDFVDSQNGWVACIGSIVGDKLMRTQDGGNTWAKQPASGVQVDFVDGHVGWLVEAFRNRISRTLDGGASWTLTTARGRQVLDIAAVSEDEAWAIDGGSLLHTTNGGQTWQVVPHPYTGDPRLDLAAIFFLGGQHGWVLGLETGGALPLPVRVLRTTDGGKSLAPAHAPAADDVGTEGASHLHFANAMHGWAAFGGPSLLHTEDGGKTWALVTPVVDGKEIHARYYDCCFPTPEIGWAVGSVGREALAITTQDGGRTWRRSGTGAEGVTNGKLTQVVFADPAHGWAIGYGGIPPSDMPPREPHQVAFLLKYQPRRTP